MPDQVHGEISYNGDILENGKLQNTSAYVSQYDQHTPEMTVREILNFSARCQGIGNRAEILREVCRREKMAGIVPKPEIDAFMKATSVSGLEKSLQTDYILKILGLNNCADTIVGDLMRRGISGGENRRLGTAEMLVGPKTVLFMDEISNGLDSFTTFQIITCIQQLVHVMGYTTLISLLQPAPEVFDLFDDIILFGEGKVVYQGPKDNVLKFFEECGFKCPRRKGVADFLQEVISERDQKQYWCNNRSFLKRTKLPYEYISVDELSEKFKTSQIGQQLNNEMCKKKNYRWSLENVLSSHKYSLTKWNLFRACMDRELLVMWRNSSFYSFKLAQVFIIAVITMTAFFRTTVNVDLKHTNQFLGSLFYSIIRIMVNGVVELPMTMSRLPVFHKQRDLNFYPAWIYSIPICLLKVPLSLLESIVWTCTTYYGIGYTPEVERFLCQVLVFFALHQASLALFRFIGSICRSKESTIFISNLIMQTMFFFGGFIVPKSSMPAWLRWGFWSSLVSYVEIGVVLNEFLAPRWKKVSLRTTIYSLSSLYLYECDYVNKFWLLLQQFTSKNLTISEVVLTKLGLNFDDGFYWISLGVIFGFALVLNICFILAMTFLNSAGKSQPIVSYNKLHHLAKQDGPNSATKDNFNNHHRTPQPTKKCIRQNGTKKERSEIVLPFQPLTLTFRNIYYTIETPREKSQHLLHDVTGAFRPGILTALMGVTGAGKTTLMDVLAGRKIGGCINGDIRVGGHPKVQDSFARISGYCEQLDVHSPQMTVEESLILSAWLRLPRETDKGIKEKLVKEVLERVELDEIKDTLVGIPGISGLSNEQRKRLTVAVELVANPSVIFMDEPTTGLDARAAAIVMRAVKNVADMGRTVVCTIHQPSIDIFESFDELILMKKGGTTIYSGPLGENSRKLVDYFQKIPGIPNIKENQNPATWILDITNTQMEAKLGLDLTSVYMISPLYADNLKLVEKLSKPLGSTKLCFQTRYACHWLEQYQACFWKQNRIYWRSPEYNITRLTYMVIMSIMLALLMMQKGQKISNEQDMLNIIGSTFVMLHAIGLNNSASIIPVVAIDRTVFYRERFAGMYSSCAYSLALLTIELPYVLIEAILFVLITYPTVGFYPSASKIIWYSYATFCKLLTDTYLGMFIVSLSPSVELATILSAACYTLLNLFSGFFLPEPAIPKWWSWCYWISPTSWSLRALFTSQYGDIEDEITAFGERKTISSFLADYFGFHHDTNSLAIMLVVLPMFPILFAFLFALSTAKLNLQRR